MLQFFHLKIYTAALFGINIPQFSFLFPGSHSHVLIPKFLFPGSHSHVLIPRFSCSQVLVPRFSFHRGPWFFHMSIEHTSERLMNQPHSLFPSPPGFIRLHQEKRFGPGYEAISPIHRLSLWNIQSLITAAAGILYYRGRPGLLLVI